ncbi:glycosyltransferase family 2 protein [Parasediminibacterium paludis]|uniref:Glycosyltransferase family 2 protein n=1 Tax=Parasediminibacterium paludis TaxID=908966 RepID=A0ABV8PX00_9BACT
MTNKAIVSVIITVYNTSIDLVTRAIDSVLRQDFQGFEIIVIDDGSNNDTYNQLLDYIKEREDKITYIRHRNCGQSLSINRGILNSNGKYIAILDSDDEYKPNHLSNCLEQMRYADLIASTTTTIVNSEDDYFVPDRADNNKLVHVDDCILLATFFGKKEVFEMLKFTDMYAADAHFFEQASLFFRVKKVALGTYIYYRNRADSICSALKTKQVLNHV